jgi:hypothetical protein
MLLAAAFAALLVAGLAGGATSARTFKLSARLTVGQERPVPPDSVQRARGTFTGTLVGRRLTWKLTYTRLSGKAKAAHIHLGAPDTIGPIIVTLCTSRCIPPVDTTCPCSVTGKGIVTDPFPDVKTLNAIRAGRTYVNIHTAKNPRGEIRGKIVAVAVP